VLSDWPVRFRLADAAHPGANCLVVIARMITLAYMLEVRCPLLVVFLWSAAVEQVAVCPGVVLLGMTVGGFWLG